MRRWSARLKLTVLDRVDMRWQVQLELSPALPVRGLTVGLVAEDGRPLGPAVVAHPGESGLVELSVRGPCTLPPGTVARVTLDIEGQPAVTHDLVVDRRRGLHAWLHADGALPLESTAELQALSSSEARRLARAWCWLGQPEPEEPDCGCAPDDMKSLLRDCGVDVDDLSPELAEQLRGGKG